MDADSQEETERSPKAQRLSDGSRSRAGLRANGSINGSLDGSLSPETDGEDPLTLATAPLLPAPLPAATAAGTAGTAAAPAASPATDPDEDTDYADEHDEDDDEEEDARPQGAVSQHLSLSRYLSYNVQGGTSLSRETAHVHARAANRAKFGDGSLDR